jgi:ATP-dependent RNA helicase UAP56/SUB2
MSSHDNEELIDYEDEHDIVPNGATASTTNGAAATAADGEGDKDKKNFSGIHSTGFRYVQCLVLCHSAHVENLLGTSC